MPDDEPFMDILEGRGPKIELKIVNAPASHPLRVTSPAGREVACITSHDEVVVASDITLDEARGVIEQLMFEIVRMDRERRDA
jgi:hypothetical protein